MTVKVREWRGDVVFLHEIVPGAADRSYGIQVARLAGLPGQVIERAKQVLKQLEEHDRKRPAAALIDDLPLFSTGRPAPSTQAPMVRSVVPDEVKGFIEELQSIVPDDFSPREALQLIYDLKAKARALSLD